LNNRDDHERSPALKPPGQGRGRPFEKGRSGNPGGRRRGYRGKATLAAALLAGETGASTRKSVEMALGGGPTAMRHFMDRVLPPCRERTIKCSLTPASMRPSLAEPGC
jgi:hypothetical protein